MVWLVRSWGYHVKPMWSVLTERRNCPYFTEHSKRSTDSSWHCQMGQREAGSAIKTHFIQFKLLHCTPSHWINCLFLLCLNGKYTKFWFFNFFECSHMFMLFFTPVEQKLKRSISEKRNERKINIILAPCHQGCRWLHISLSSYPEACDHVCSVSHQRRNIICSMKS